ncbi:MAG: hypothetical protein M1587_03740 [Thaumarchaeota archaeon]|nr:hypothetical protein [Nitrososphaerota archaeon]
MNTKMIGKEKAISPIIATLLLILIAIAAGVVVYAYVIGFIGNSTSNSGATTNTLSIDQVTFSHSPTSVPVTAYVRNEGPSTESFNTGFFVKGSSLNDQLSVGILVSASSNPTDTFTTVTLGAGSSSGVVGVELYGGICVSADTATVTLFGTTVTVTCGTSNNIFFGRTSAVQGFTFSNSTSSTNLGTQSASVTMSAPTVIGVPVSSGATINLAINQVGEFSLAVAGIQVSNPITAGQTYTVQVTGTDGGSAVASAKAS